MNQTPATDSPQSQDWIYAITRPDSNLLVYYVLSSLRALIFFPVVLPVLLAKYFTLQYRFDDEGVSMRWGLLFRREINLTYSRIQDIHLSRGVLERWLGLATLSIQTASGQAGAEMSIQGIKQYETLRDFLYAKMRGRRERRRQQAQSAQQHSNEALELLREIHQHLAAIRQASCPASPAADSEERPS